MWVVSTRFESSLPTEPLSIERDYKPTTFSFNSGTGRCPTCTGTGFEHIEMQFLSDVYLTCPDCDGKRFRQETLDVKVAPAVGCDAPPSSVADVLNMTARDAVGFFADRPEILKSVEPLVKVGLDYLKLGQPVPTLSGGEAQRLKLASHLVDKGDRPRGQTTCERASVAPV